MPVVESRIQSNSANTLPGDRDAKVAF